MAVEFRTREEIAKKEVAIAVEKCRACDSSEIKDIFSMGDIRVARFSEDAESICSPLTFCHCGKCGYLQLRHNINTDLVFYPEYGYESGINPRMVEELGDIVQATTNAVDLEPGDKWLDIASNDGTLLLQTQGDIYRVGFDPSRGVAMKGAGNLVEKFGAEKTAVFIDYFDEVVWRRRFGEEKAKVITAIAVFYSVQKPQKFLKSVKEVLHPEGVFVVQQNYTPEMIDQNAFCNVVHEHVTYPTLSSFLPLLERQGFKVLDVAKTPINGGSFRVFIGHAEGNLVIPGGEERVREMLEKEKKAGYLTAEPYQDFGKNIVKKGTQVKNYLDRVKQAGGKIYGLAASTRGNTRLQVWGLGSDLIDGIAEKNLRKIGGETLGIPIVSDEKALANADILFVSIWFYGDSIVEAYKPFLEKGGKMLFPSNEEGQPYLVEIKEGEIVKTYLTDVA